MFDLSKKKKKKKPKKVKAGGDDEDGAGEGAEREEGEGNYNYETLLERIQVCQFFKCRTNQRRFESPNLRSLRRDCSRKKKVDHGSKKSSAIFPPFRVRGVGVLASQCQIQVLRTDFYRTNRLH